MLLYPPPQIALGALHVTLDLGWYLDLLIGGADEEEEKKKKEFLAVLERIASVFRARVQNGESLKVSSQATKEADKKLKKCRNPKLNPDSKTFKDNEAKTKEEALRKKQKKQLEIKEKEANEFRELMGMDEKEAVLDSIPSSPVVQTCLKTESSPAITPADTTARRRSSGANTVTPDNFIRRSSRRASRTSSAVKYTQ